MDVALEYAIKNKLMGSSAIKCKVFRNIFKDFDIKTIVEIGTYKGISAAHMAHFARNIFTFDIKDYPEKYKVWYDLGLSNRIFYYTIKRRKKIREILKNIKFDFAFIDAIHTYKSVKADFKLVESCGRVLFHDIHKKAFAGVRKFVVEELGAKEKGTVAYWSK